jgi:hypothetical protein
MTQNILIGILGIGGFLMYSIYDRIKTERRKTSVIKKHNTLISLLCGEHQKSKTKKITPDALSFSISQIGGTAVFFIIQSLGIIATEIEFNSNKHGRHSVEWFFPENTDHTRIYDKICTDMIVSQKKDAVTNEFAELFSHHKIDQGHNQPIGRQTKSFVDVNAGQLFCIAWQGVTTIENYQTLSKKGQFEVLFLNSFMALDVFWDTLNVSYYEIEEDLISLLVFYLNKHHPTESIKSFNNLINSRIDFYRNEVNKVNHSNPYDFTTLHHYFYVNPLISNANNNTPLNDPLFLNTVDLMLASVKGNTRQYLQNSGALFVSY